MLRFRDVPLVRLLSYLSDGNGCVRPGHGAFGDEQGFVLRHEFFKSQPNHALRKHEWIPLGQPDFPGAEVQPFFVFFGAQHESDSGFEFTTIPKFALNRSTRGKVNLAGFIARPLLIPVVADCQSFLCCRDCRKEKQYSHKCKNIRNSTPYFSVALFHAAPPEITSNSSVLSEFETRYTAAFSALAIRRI